MNQIIKRIAIIFFILVTTAFITTTILSFTVWKSKDIPAIKVGTESAPISLCIASRSGEFKSTIVTQLIDSLKNSKTFINVIGVKQLAEINPSQYDAIVIINTCIAWKIEKDVQKFFDKNSTYKEVVLFTSSGDEKGCGEGDIAPDYVDAISSASIENGDSVVQDILLKVRPLLKR